MMTTAMSCGFKSSGPFRKLTTMQLFSISFSSSNSKDRLRLLRVTLIQDYSSHPAFTAVRTSEPCRVTQNMRTCAITK